MTRLVLLLLPFVGHFTFGQSIRPTKSQLLKVFKKSIRQDTKGQVIENSNPWIICNKDSSFYKSDTLTLNNKVNFYHQSGCCDFIDWTFYKKDAFVSNHVYICDELSAASVPKTDDWFTLNLSDTKIDLFLELFNQGKSKDKFKVISIDETNKTVILVRQ